jgi:hypothetical protein
MPVAYENLTGRKYGKLLANKRLYADKHRTSVWECICECGAVIKARSNNLKSGHTQSCGKCIHKNPNSYYEKDNYMVGVLSNGEEFYFDKVDYEIIKSRKWYKSKLGYVTDCRANYLNVVLLNPQKGYVTDHKNGNGLDNRRNNLRICTQQQNVFNQKKRTTKTSSRYKGVSFSKRANKFIAYISCNYKRTYIGTYKNEIDAARAYNNKAIEYFGEYAKLNTIN